MRGLITRSPLEYPGRSAKLNWSHPATSGGSLRLAAVALPNNSLVDLLSGFTSTWTLGAGEQNALGPTVYPASTTSGGYTFPSPFGQEVLSKGVTLAVIFQPRVMTRGQGLINTNNDLTQGANPVKITTTNIGTLNYSVGGSGFAFGPTTLTAGRNYAAFASIRPTGAPAPKEFFGLVDLVTGQKWFATWTANTTTTSATNYSVATYIGGTVDNGRVAAAAIVARSLTPGEVTSWMDDPWGLWYDASAPNLMFAAGTNTAVIPPPPTGGLLANPFSYVALATANATSVTSRPSSLTGWDMINLSTSTRYVRVYNKATAPVPASDAALIVARFAIPAGQRVAAQLGTNAGWLSTGLAFDITAGIADTDATVTAAGDVIVNLFFE